MHIKNKKNFKLLSLILIILFLICIYSVFKPFKYPLSKFDSIQDGGSIGKITENLIVKNSYISTADKLDTLSIIASTDGKKISAGTLEVKIYDKDNLIYRNQYNLSDINDNEYLNFEFDVQEKSIGKEYIVEIEIKNLGENDEISFHGNADVSKISSSNNMQFESSLLFIVHGEFPSYIYTCIIFLLFLIILFINFYKNIEMKYNLSKCKLLLKNILLVIVSLLMAFGIFAVYVSINYNLNISPFILLFTMLTMCIVVLNLSFECQKKESKIENLFLALAIPLGALFLIFIVPGSAPDESFHFKMVYRLSNLSFETSNYSFPYSGTVEYSTYREAVKAIVYKNEVTGFGTFNGIGYSFILYLIPALGFKLFSLFSNSMLLNMYGASFLNYLLYIISGFLIIRKMPSFKYLMLLYLITPLYLQQATSLSCDAMIFPCCLYFIAYILDIKQNKNEIKLKDLIVICILSVFIFTAKFAYFPLLGLLILIRKQLVVYMKKNKHLFIIILATTIIILGMFTYEYKFKKYDYANQTVVEYEEKIPKTLQGKNEYTLSSFNKIPAVAIKTIEMDGTNYITDFAGMSLKWDEVKLPAVIPIVFYIILLITIFFDKFQFDKKTNKLFITIFIINLLVVFAGLYTDGALRSLYVEGVQGRYFIPFAVLLLMTLKKDYVKINFNDNQKKIILMTTILFINIIALKYLMISYVG